MPVISLNDIEQYVSAVILSIECIDLVYLKKLPSLCNLLIIPIYNRFSYFILCLYVIKWLCILLFCEHCWNVWFKIYMIVNAIINYKMYLCSYLFLIYQISFYIERLTQYWEWNVEIINATFGQQIVLCSTYTSIHSGLSNMRILCQRWRSLLCIYFVINIHTLHTTCIPSCPG